MTQLHEDETAPGPGLELWIFETDDGPHARWLIDDGRLLSEVTPAKARLGALLESRSGAETFR